MHRSWNFGRVSRKFSYQGRRICNRDLPARWTINTRAVGGTICRCWIRQGVLGLLQSDALRSHRALWNDFAGNATWLAERQGELKGTSVAKGILSRAAQRDVGTTGWLMDLAKLHLASHRISRPTCRISCGGMRGWSVKWRKTVLRTISSSTRQRLGFITARDPTIRQYSKPLTKNWDNFLGYGADKVETDASPDPWWKADETFCFVFRRSQRCEEKRNDRREEGPRQAATTRQLDPPKMFRSSQTPRSPNHAHARDQSEDGRNTAYKKVLGMAFGDSSGNGPARRWVRWACESLAENRDVEWKQTRWTAIGR